MKMKSLAMILAYCAVLAFQGCATTAEFSPASQSNDDSTRYTLSGQGGVPAY